MGAATDRAQCETSLSTLALCLSWWKTSSETASGPYPSDRRSMLDSRLEAPQSKHSDACKLLGVRSAWPGATLTHCWYVSEPLALLRARLLDSET
jgi:hypothetical protein